MGSTKSFSEDTTVEIDVDLDEWDTEDLIAELKERELSHFSEDFLEKLYQKFCNGQADDAIQDVKDLIRDKLGKFVK